MELTFPTDTPLSEGGQILDAALGAFASVESDATALLAVRDRLHPVFGGEEGLGITLDVVDPSTESGWRAISIPQGELTMARSIFTIARELGASAESALPTVAESTAVNTRTPDDPERWTETADQQLDVVVEDTPTEDNLGTEISHATFAEPAARRRGLRAMLSKTGERLTTDRSKRIAGILVATATLAIYGTLAKHGLGGLHEHHVGHHDIAAYITKATHLGEAALGSVGALGSVIAIGKMSRRKKDRGPKAGTVGIYELFGIPDPDLEEALAS